MQKYNEKFCSMTFSLPTSPVMKVKFDASAAILVESMKEALRDNNAKLVMQMRDRIADLEHYIEKFCLHPVPNPRDIYIAIPKLSDMEKTIKRQSEKLREKSGI